MIKYTDSQIAHVCHEANRALQLVTGDSLPSRRWEDESDDTRFFATSVVSDVRGGATPEQLHERWCMQKAAVGWVFGTAKDAVKKTHPCLVPYEQLPQAQRDKDTLFMTVVRALSGES
jgi:hypothetical protein